jgi:AhpD family alkylhydroperoxidase
MCRISPIHPNAVTAVREEVLDVVRAKFGMVPMMARTMAQSPAVVAGWAALDAALGEGVLGVRVSELIALAVAQVNSSPYCLAAHNAIGELAGLSPAEVVEARRGHAADPKEAAAIRLALAILETRGAVSDEVLCLSRDAGLSDAEITEVSAHVALNVFTNYFTRLADPEIDFPRVDGRLPGNPA